MFCCGLKEKLPEQGLARASVSGYRLIVRRQLETT